MSFCSTFNDTSLGWSKFVFGHGVLNFIAGYVAVFAVLAPIVSIVAAIIHKSISGGIVKTMSLFWVLLFVLVIGIACLYSVIYFMEQRPLVSGLFVLGAIFSVLASCTSVYTISIVKE